MKYLYQGLHGHADLVSYIWTATLFNITAFFLFLIPQTRENQVTLNIGCILVFIGVYIEKGMGLVIPGFVPDVLGDFYEYSPTGDPDHERRFSRKRRRDPTPHRRRTVPRAQT
jgi:molybdopterin-containing oxidoreductase family membrane subunit